MDLRGSDRIGFMGSDRLNRPSRIRPCFDAPADAHGFDVPRVQNCLLEFICWPQNFRLAFGSFWTLFLNGLAPCKNWIWPPWVLSEKPYFFTFLTNSLQIFTKFLYFEGF